MVDGETPRLGLFSLDGDPISLPFVWPVVPDGVVEYATVVPNRYGIFGPPEAALEVDTLAVFEQEIQQCPPLLLWEIIDGLGEFTVDVQRRTSAVDMTADNRVVRHRPGRIGDRRCWPGTACDRIPRPSAGRSARRASASFGPRGHRRRRTSTRTGCRRRPAGSYGAGVWMHGAAPDHTRRRNATGCRRQHAFPK